MRKGVYYTTISKKQINILYGNSSMKYPEKEDVIHLTKSMSDYLYKIADCGGGYVFDKQEEEFRKRIHESVGLVLKGQCTLAEEVIMDAFRLLVNTKTGKDLDIISKELNCRDQETKSNQKEERQ